jgi:hypothetical protein
MSFLTNSLVNWLLSHAYGQGGTVAVPSPQEAVFQMPKGEFPAGIDDVLEYISGQYISWSGSSDRVDWCFLIGGPGNGKSESLRTLADKLSVVLPMRAIGQPVPRTIPANWPSTAHALASGLEIVFINDASIPRPNALAVGCPGSLFQDVSDALARFTSDGAVPVAVFANVNRGILVEENRALTDNPGSSATPDGGLAARLIPWLAGTSSQTDIGSAEFEVTVPVDSVSPHYGQCRIKTTNHRNIVVHAIFLDALSLLEPRPGAGAVVVDFAQAPPRPAQYRTLGSLISTDVPRDETTAGRLLKNFVAQARWAEGGCRDASGQMCDAFATCPFAQNVAWLQDDMLRHRFLDGLRAAEVAAGRRFTYRDLLGHVSLAILGRPESEWLEETTSPCGWSRQRKLDIAQGKISSLVALQLHRVYFNLFGNAVTEAKRFADPALGGENIFGAIKRWRASAGESPRIQSFERAFRDIDPSRDTDPWQGSRTRVLDAVESLDVQSPSEQAAQWTQLSPHAHSEVERLLDHALREEIATELAKGTQVGARRVRALRCWRGMLMLRQVGLALGCFNFGAAIDAWLAEQENALRGGHRMRLGDGLHHLIIPPQATGHVYFAPLRPRTYCLSELPPDTMLVSVATSDLEVVVMSHGDTLVAEVQMSRAREKKPPLTLAGLVIDLAVAREAILHDGTDTRSFTEIGYTAFARIERARASLISRDRMKSMVPHFTDRAGQLFKVSQSPGGQVPLRVQKA